MDPEWFAGLINSCPGNSIKGAGPSRTKHRNARIRRFDATLGTVLGVMAGFLGGGLDRFGILRSMLNSPKGGYIGHLSTTCSV